MATLCGISGRIRLFFPARRAPAGPTEETALWRCGASDLWQAAWNLPGTAQPNVCSAVGGSSPRQTDRADRQAAHGRHKCES